MKQLNFIVQAKGGVGKSLLTYLFGLTKQSDELNLFVDVDSSTKTSTRQLTYLGEDRTETLSLLNEKEVLVRDKFITYLESLTETSFKNIYFDFGAPESEQFPALIERDLPFKEFLDELDFQAHFHIVVGGGGAYTPSVEYLQKMLKALNHQFEITIWQSITTFNNFPILSKELQNNCDKLKIRLCQFGDFDPSSNLGSQILDGIRKGFGINNYQTGARIKLKKELNDNFKNE
jgi:hypothetical protein